MVNVSASTSNQSSSSAQINDSPDVSLVDEDSSCYVRILLFLLLTFLFNWNELFQSIFIYFIQNQFKSKNKSKSSWTDDISILAASVTNFLGNRKKEVETKQPTQTLKHYTMWANFDALVSKFDDDDIVVLNIDITNLIESFLKRKREKNELRLIT